MMVGKGTKLKRPQPVLGGDEEDDDDEPEQAEESTEETEPDEPEPENETDTEDDEPEEDEPEETMNGADAHRQQEQDGPTDVDDMAPPPSDDSGGVFDIGGLSTKRLLIGIALIFAAIVLFQLLAQRESEDDEGNERPANVEEPEIDVEEAQQGTQEVNIERPADDPLKADEQAFDHVFGE